ncbi:MAG: ribosomal-processing cysteine protease Prp [Eubacterium sp.]|nr:ribosomal-processing cysteine protease Prp [Eubacterium sp.]
MTKIRFFAENGKILLIADGHASEGHKEDGNIICAAESMLIQTIAKNVIEADDEGTAKNIQVDLLDGHAIIACDTSDIDLIAAVKGIAKGFELLSECYPNIISYNRSQKVSKQ